MYEQHVCQVHASSEPLALSATGFTANVATNFYKRLASFLPEKWDQAHSNTLYWLKCLVSLSLLRSAIQCIGGARSSCNHPIKL